MRKSMIDYDMNNLLSMCKQYWLLIFSSTTEISHCTPQSKLLILEDLDPKILHTCKTHGKSSWKMIKFSMLMPFVLLQVYLHTAPLCHIGGLSSAMTMLMVGGCHVLMPKFDAESALGAIEQYAVTSFITVPAIMASLISVIRYIPVQY